MTKKQSLTILGVLAVGAAFLAWRNRSVQVNVVTGIGRQSAIGNPSDPFATLGNELVASTGVISVPAHQAPAVISQSLKLAGEVNRPAPSQTMPDGFNLTGIGNNLMTG